MEAADEIHLTHERLIKLLHYDPEKGSFMWLVSRRRIRAGDVAGAINGHGYVLISVDGRKYPAHRLAFLYMTGAFPPDMVDHIDMNTANNVWTNLRAATRSQNGANRVGYKNSQTRIKGVYPSGTKFKAMIQIDGKLKYLGTRETAEAAKELYVAAANDAFGEYARANAA